MLSFIVITLKAAPKIELLVIAITSGLVFRVLYIKKLLPYNEPQSVGHLPATLKGLSPSV